MRDGFQGLSSVARTSFGSKWDASQGHATGFDYMRIGLALAVLTWHSYPITWGASAALSVWASHWGLVLEQILPAFFALSGFLVTGSLERNASLVTFLLLRVIRIFPALAVEVVLCALILGPIVTSFSPHNYFSGQELYSYFMNIVGRIHYTLPGVFIDRPIPGTVNGSLWTVPHELECYILLTILVLIGFRKRLAVSAATFVVCSILLAVYYKLTGQTATPPGYPDGRILILCFLAGALIFRFRYFVPCSGYVAFLSFIASVILFRSDPAVYVAPIFAAYATVYVGLLQIKPTEIIRSGDFSYGTYLYAFPIQQTTGWVLGEHNTYFSNLLIAMPITVALALFSWWCIEKPFQRVKRFVVRGSSTRTMAPADLAARAGAVSKPS